MRVEFRRAILPEETRSLLIFDHKAFHEYPSDWFDRDTWTLYECWWMLVDGRKAGCCAFERDGDFLEDISDEQDLYRVPASLYIATTGILPRYRGHGLGSLLKCWQISYARHHGYRRIVTNTRESNLRMIGLNSKFGFKVLRTTAAYYRDPLEATVVMELKL